MAKRKRSTAQIRRTECMRKEIPRQRQKMLKQLNAKKLTRKQHNLAFTRASKVCTR